MDATSKAVREGRGGKEMRKKKEVKKDAKEERR